MTPFFRSVISKLALLYEMKPPVGCLMKFMLNRVGFPGRAGGSLSFALFVHILVQKPIMRVTLNLWHILSIYSYQEDATGRVATYGVRKN